MSQTTAHHVDLWERIQEGTCEDISVYQDWCRLSRREKLAAIKQWRKHSDDS